MQVLPHLSKGGAERVVVELSNSLVELDNEVTVLLAYPVAENLNQQDLNRKVNVQFVSANSENRFFEYTKLPFWVVRNWKSLKTYDVIHCHLTYGLIFGFIIACLRKIERTTNIKLIATCHVVGVGVTTFPRILNEKLSYCFDHFVLMALDSKWRNFIGVKKRKNIQVIVNGISPNLASRKLRKIGKNSNYRIGTISRLQAERKPWLFVDTFSQVHGLVEGHTQFILGGEGPERSALAMRSEKLGLGAVLSMPGLVQNPYAFLESLDLYITLNVEAITGIAGLEAIFSGIPVIGIQLSPDYESGATDWIWSDQEPMSVAQRIVELIRNPGELSAIAEEQYEVASKKFSVVGMRNSYLTLYTAKESQSN